MVSRSLLNLFAVTLLAFTLAACGDTWRGAKQDTGENMQATGQALEDAGESVKE